MINAYPLFFAVLLFFIPIYGMKKEYPVRWENQSEQCLIARLPKETITITNAASSFYDVLSLKRTCHGAYEDIDFIPVILNSIKDKTYLCYRLKENASLCTRILRYYASQHQDLSDLFNSSKDPLPENFLIKTNNIKAIINAVWPIHPNTSLLIQSDPYGHSQEQSIESFEDLISSLLLKPKETANIDAQFQQLKHFLSKKNYIYTCDDILAIKNILLQYHQFPNKTGLLECLCCLGDINIIETFLSSKNRGIHAHKENETPCYNYSFYNHDCYRTALIFACKHGKYKLAEFLIKKGALVCGTTICYPNILSFLIQHRRSSKEKIDNKIFHKLITLLISNNVDPNATFEAQAPDSGRQIKLPLIYYSALGEGDIEFAKLLLNHGVNHNITKNTGSILHWIRCRHNHPDQCKHIKVAHLFLEKYPEIINVTDQNGDTALHHAAYHNEINLIEFLLKNGANPNVFNKEGETPISVVNTYHKNNSDQTITLLLKYGATPIHILNLKYYAKAGAKYAGIGIIFIAAYQCFKKLFEN